MYRQVYHHRVLLASESVNRAIVQRARDLGSGLPFCDETARAVLESKTPLDLSLENIFDMRESWWRYHVQAWRKSSDKILSDLCDRLLNRRLFKTVRIDGDEEQLLKTAKQAVLQAGFDPHYYLHIIRSEDVHLAEAGSSMQVLKDNGEIVGLGECEPLWDALTREAGGAARRSWLVLPGEAKALLGRER